MTITTETTIAPTTVVQLNAVALRDVLGAHLLSTGTDTLLPVFRNIRLQLTGDRLHAESTDRYRLLFTDQPVTDPVGEFDIMLDRDDAKRIVAALPKTARPGTDYAFLSVIGTMLKIDMTSGGLSVAVDVTGQSYDWPKIETIFKDESVATERIGFNPKHLADFAKLPRERNTPATLDLRGSGKPAQSTWTYRDVNYRFAIMSMRLTD